MTERQYLLAKLAEECAEVIQAVTKCLRFGEDDTNPKSPEEGANFDKLVSEVADLRAIIQILDLESLHEDGDLEQEAMTGRVINIYKWLNYAKEQGQIKD